MQENEPLSWEALEFEYSEKKRKVYENICEKLQPDGQNLNLDVLEQISKLLKKNKSIIAICTDCKGSIFQGYKFDYITTSKWGDERPFCSSCINYCKPCDEQYVSETKYQHDDCKTDQDEDSGEDDK
jgi:hypothetical protein